MNSKNLPDGRFFMGACGSGIVQNYFVQCPVAKAAGGFCSIERLLWYVEKRKWRVYE
jgi:hypothetical protein